jgi:hypothetical protein
VVEAPRTFTLDEIAAGAKNDAFVDEYLKDKEITLFGQVQRIERVVHTAVDDAGARAIPPTIYRLVMQRTGHEDRALDMQVYFVFAAAARKDLALLEPGVTKVTVLGRCTATQLQVLERGFNFVLELQDCKIIPTPTEFEITPGPRTPIIPNVIPDDAPPVIPRPVPPAVPAPPLPPLPMPGIP